MKKLAATLMATGIVMLAAPVPTLAQTGDEEQAEDDAYDPDAVRCESRPITGSRARRERICMTNAEWAELRSNGNRDANQLVEDGTRIGVRGN